MGSSEKSKIVVENPNVSSESETSAVQKPVSNPVSTSTADEIIMLDSDTDPEDTQNKPESSNEHKEQNSVVSTSTKEENEDEPMSLSELSSSFQKCFQSNAQCSRTRETNKTEESSGLLQFKPFDYEAARQQVRFGDVKEDASSQGDGEDDDDGLRKPRDSGRKKSSIGGRGQTSDLTKEFPQGRRRQAFPASGNRSATFR